MVEDSVIEAEASNAPTPDKMVMSFIKMMAVLDDLPTEQARFTLVNWCYEALDQRPGPLSETGGRTPAFPLPRALFAIRCGKILVNQRFLSEKSARDWAQKNYKGHDVFTIEQITG
jgi:hypothetical protein